MLPRFGDGGGLSVKRKRVLDNLLMKASAMGTHRPLPGQREAWLASSATSRRFVQQLGEALKLCDHSPYPCESPYLQAGSKKSTKGRYVTGLGKSIDASNVSFDARNLR